MKFVYVIFGMAILIGVAKVVAYFTDSDFNTMLTFVVAVELLAHGANDKRHNGKLIQTDEEAKGAYNEQG